MAVYARGYRSYASEFKGPPAFLTIFREGYRSAFRSRGFRMIGIFFLVWFVIWAIVLYFQIAVVDEPQRRVPKAWLDYDGYSGMVLAQTLANFYAFGISILTALLAMLVGSGLVADDLRANALPLYLVRPIRPLDYVLGKALILPGILAHMTLLPGLAYLLLVSFWQPPGESWSFLAGHLDVAWVILRHFLVASASYVGLMMFLSSRSPRRGAVAALAAAVVFGGSMLYALGQEIPGSGGSAFRLLSLPANTIEGFMRHSLRGHGKHLL